MLFKYLGKGIYFCFVMPIIGIFKVIFLIIKYILKGVFAPIILIKTAIEEDKEATNIVKKEMQEVKKKSQKLN